MQTPVLNTTLPCHNIQFDVNIKELKSISLRPVVSRNKEKFQGGLHVRSSQRAASKNTLGNAKLQSTSQSIDLVCITIHPTILSFSAHTCPRAPASISTFTELEAYTKSYTHAHTRTSSHSPPPQPGSTHTCRMVGRPWGQFQGATRPDRLSKILRMRLWSRGVPIMMEVRQARLASTARTLRGGRGSSGAEQSNELCVGVS